MALSFPSSTNVFVPSHKATGGLMVGFSRNATDFPINKYIQIIPVDKPIGLYAVWNSKQQARIRNNDLRDFMWKDGNPAPHGADNLESFAYVRFECNRYAFPFTIGDMTIATADWGILQAHSQMVAAQCMTGRSALAYTLWSDETQWGTHAANVDGVAGTLNGNAALLASGKNWLNGTADEPHIKRTMNLARLQISRDTLAVLKPSDMTLTISPETAAGMSESPEIHSYLKESMFARDQIRGDVPNQNMDWGLPNMLYGSHLNIDDTIIDSSQKPDTNGGGFLFPSGNALFTARIGGLEGIGGGPAHSTLVLFYYKDDMTVQSYHDVNNLLTQGRVVTNFTVVLSNPNSGYLLKRALG